MLDRACGAGSRTLPASGGMHVALRNQLLALRSSSGSSTCRPQSPIPCADLSRGAAVPGRAYLNVNTLLARGSKCGNRVRADEALQHHVQLRRKHRFRVMPQPAPGPAQSIYTSTPCPSGQHLGAGDGAGQGMLFCATPSETGAGLHAARAPGIAQKHSTRWPPLPASHGQIRTPLGWGQTPGRVRQVLAARLCWHRRQSFRIFHPKRSGQGRSGYRLRQSGSAGSRSIVGIAVLVAALASTPLYTRGATLGAVSVTAPLTLICDA